MTGVLPFDEAGEGPAVVLLHAGVAERSMWAEHLPALAASGHRAIAVDLPGFGAAPEGATAPWIEVLRTMSELGIDRAVLVGNSLGGAVALRVAHAAPERVRALMLISAPPPGFEPSEQLREAWRAEEEAYERGDIDGAVAAVVAAWTLPDAPEALREHIAAAQRRVYEHAAAAGAYEEPPDPLGEDPSALTRLAMPVLALAGEWDMPDFREGAVALAQTLPNAHDVLIAGAGHLAPLETPEVFRALMLESLSELDD
jgi:pimeloyl-ACP methyl ester carboxylesterase